MNENIIKFYQIANNLKRVIRTGWKEVGISSDRIESVAEHVYGCMVLSIAIISEKNLNLDICKVLKMVVLKELKKVNLEIEHTPDGQEYVNGIDSVINYLSNKEELLQLFEEVQANTSAEAKFVNKVCKIESDLQAKIYDMNGQFSLENALADVKNYGEPLASEIGPQVKNASDGWILFDRRYYAGDENFESLSQDIQKL